MRTLGSELQLTSSFPADTLDPVKTACILHERQEGDVQFHDIRLHARVPPHSGICLRDGNAIVDSIVVAAAEVEFPLLVFDIHNVDDSGDDRGNPLLLSIDGLYIDDLADQKLGISFDFPRLCLQVEEAQVMKPGAGWLHDECLEG